MSRPQYDYYQPQQQAAAVVNGGLIDFRDNSLQRGVQQEYITPNQFMAAGYATPNAMMAAQSGQFQPSPMMAAQSGQFQPAPNPMMAAQSGQFQPAPAGNLQQSGYISGPPSFLHVNGVTYKPVEDHPMMAQDPKPIKPCETVQAEPGVKTLSEEDFHHAISEHVQKKVDSYMSKQHHRNDHPVKASKGSVKRGHVDEEQAAMRVQAVNASMRGKSKPAWQTCVNNW